MITLLKSVIADEFLGKQQFIINIGIQHSCWPVGISDSDFLSEKCLYIRWVNFKIPEETHFGF